MRYFGSRAAHGKIQRNFTVAYFQQFTIIIKGEHVPAHSAGSVTLYLKVTAFTENDKAAESLRLEGAVHPPAQALCSQQGHVEQVAQNPL